METNENTAFQIVINGYNPIVEGTVNVITVKHYEAEIQKAIENKVHGRGWWHIVQRAIFDELYDLFEQNKNVHSLDMMSRIQEYIEEILGEADINICEGKIEATYKGEQLDVIRETKYTLKVYSFRLGYKTFFKHDKGLNWRYVPFQQKEHSNDNTNKSF